MGFINEKISYDAHGKITQPRLFLANPQKTHIGELYDVENTSVSLKITEIDEFSFTLYENSNGVKNEYFDLVEIGRLIEVQYIAWFKIKEVEISGDDGCRVANVKCLSLECELVRELLEIEEGVYGLYDVTNQEYSLLHKIAKLSTWKIGHVDNELKNKWRTLSDESTQVYNFLTTDISKSFDCIFTFDTYSKTINAYAFENFGKKTNIIIDPKNILLDFKEETSDDDIVTNLYVTGADGFDIRDVNPSATNNLINIDYYLDSKWMSQGTINGYNAYKTSIQAFMTSHTNLISALKTYLNEKNTLNNELKALESQKRNNDEIIGSYIQLHSKPPTIGQSGYDSYQNAITGNISLVTQIKNKEDQIKSKELQINNIENQLENIATDISLSQFLTQEQYDEISVFLNKYDKYEDSTFAETEEMSDLEILDMKLELMKQASEELFYKSQPQIRFTNTLSNFMNVQNESDCRIDTKEWLEDFELGNMVTIPIRGDYYATVRIIGITISFDDIDKIDVSFSNQSKLDSNTMQLSEMIANGNSAHSTITLNKLGYDKVAGMSNEIQAFINGSLNATLNAVKSNDDQEVVLDKYGLHMKKYLSSQKKYGDFQSWWNSNNLLFTSDGWRTASTAIGELTLDDGTKTYGIIADTLIGRLIIGNALTIMNDSGTYTINNDGLKASNGGNEVVINPNKPSELFKIAVNGSNRLYVDVVKNKLVFSGDLQASGGTFSGTLQGVDGTFTGVLNGNTIIGANISGGIITSSQYSGGQSYTKSDEVRITGGLIECGTETYINGSLVSEWGTKIQSNVITTSQIYADFISTLSGAGFRKIETYGLSCETLTVGGHLPITTSNIDDYIPDTVKTAYFAYDAAYADYAGAVNSSSVVAFYTNDNNIRLNTSNFNGSTSGNAAGVTWCNGRFQVASSSDMRLKNDIQTLDLPMDLFMELKPKRFKFKNKELGLDGNHFGLIAQQVESAFERYNLNPQDYNLIDIVDVRKGSNDGMYVKDKVHRLNYNNLITWLIDVVQKQEIKIRNLENKIS